MVKNLTGNQIILIVLATVLLLLAAFSFYLLQDPAAPLPFAPAPPTQTNTPPPPTQTVTPSPSETPIPTRRTSYTPFVSPGLTDMGTPPDGTITPVTLTPQTSGTAAVSGTPDGSGTPSSSASPTTPQPNTTASVSPTASQTLIAGQYRVIGRVIQNDVPIVNAVVSFSDDDPPRKSTTDSGGRYTFITLAPGTTFKLAFNQVDNPQLTPAPEVATYAWIEGTLPIGENSIELPDLEVSINIDRMVFRLVSPPAGSTYYAAVISPSNPIQFSWTLYNMGNSYFVELGQNGSTEPSWVSGNTTSTNLMWNGILNDGSQITEGTYWWRVGVNKALEDYGMVAFTHEWNVFFIP